MDKKKRRAFAHAVVPPQLLPEMRSFFAACFVHFLNVCGFSSATKGVFFFRKKSLECGISIR
jgi:hypothetical protein